MKKSTLLLLSVFIYINNIYCQEKFSKGPLDSSFGTNGSAIILNGSAYYIIEGSPGYTGSVSSFTKDNKIIIGGTYVSKDDLNYRPVLTMRLNQDGSIDETYGNGHGIDTISFNTEKYQVYRTISYCKMVDSKSDKIIIGGEIFTYDAPYRLSFLCRLNAEGTVDSSFGDNGWAITNFDEAPVYKNLAIQPNDGKIIAGGIGFTGNQNQSAAFFVARYNSDGSLDKSFGNDGHTSSLIAVSCEANDLALQNDGKILLAGYAYTGGGVYHAAMARYSSNGAPDITFGKDGSVITDIDLKTNLSDAYFGIAVQEDGKIIASGQTGYQSQNLTDKKIGVVRYNTDGSIDYGFADSGRSIVVFDGTGIMPAAGVIIQKNGKLVTGGFTTGIQVEDFALTRLNNDGTIDTGFGEKGKIMTDIGGYEEGYSMLLQHDGKIILIGNYKSKDYSQSGFTVARYLGDPSCPRIARIKRWIQNHILHFENESEDDNTLYYAVEQSNNPSYGYIPVMKINAVHKEYSYPIPANGTDTYYRIKAVNKNNSIIYSQPILEKGDDATHTNSSITISPNPVHEYLIISNLNSNLNYEIKLLDKNAAVKGFTKTRSLNNIKISTAFLNAGIYFLEIKNNEGKIIFLKFVKE